MKRASVTPNITQLTRFRLVNAFLVREADGFTLVDTTTGGAGERLIAAAHDAGAPIRRIALTHGHADHIGSVDELKAQLGDAVDVLMPEGDAARVAFDRPPDDLLRPGDRVGSLEVLATPGHTLGHVAFRDTRDGAVIGGDVFTTIARPAVTCHRNLVFPLPAAATVDRKLDLESARLLRALAPPVLAVGHGRALHDPAAPMDKAIARAERAAR